MRSGPRINIKAAEVAVQNCALCCSCTNAFCHRPQGCEQNRLRVRSLSVEQSSAHPGYKLAGIMPNWLRPVSTSSADTDIGMPQLPNLETRKSSYGSTKLMTTTMEPPDPLLPAPVLHTPRADNAANNSNQAKRKKNARVSGGLRVHWATIKRRIGTGTAPSTSSVMADSSANGSYHRRPQPDEGLDEDVDEVVVDRAWSEDIKSSVAHSETGGSPEKSDGHHPPGTSVDHESIVQHGFWGIWTPLAILRWRVYPLLMEFFSSSFFDQDAEAHYRKENWFMRKVRRASWRVVMLPRLINQTQSLALWSALFFVINWVLGVSFISHTPQLIDKIFLYGVAPALTLPIFFFVMYDWPRYVHADQANFHPY